MFPHNSSSHEISTETNAFVQNSMGDVVVLEETSLYWGGKWERSEYFRYCDIEFINSNKMAVCTDHRKATAANDSSTVLPSQTSELSSAGIGKACQSVAPVTTTNPTNLFLTYDNNKINNHNNAEHNHHKYRKQNTLGLLGQLGSSANNSKSTFKTLSDNKDSFRDVRVRVLSVNVHLQVTRGEAYCTVGVPSLVRIPKSDCPQWLLCLPNSVNSYSLLGFRLELGDNNKFKAHFSLIKNNNNNSKSVILLSSIRNSDHCFLLGGGPVEIDAITRKFGIIKDVAKRWKLLGHKCALVIINSHETSRLLIMRRYCKTSNDNCNVVRLTLALDILWNLLLKSHFGGIDLLISVTIIIISEQNLAIFTASSSITLIVSENEVTDHISQSFLENLKQLRVQSFTSPLSNVTVTELMQRICVPILKKCKGNYNNNNNYNYNNNNNNDNEYYKKNISIGSSIEDEINSSNNNPDVIEDIVDVAVCYKTSCIITNNVRILGSQNDGISRTEATIFTVGALSFQDNNKSNKRINTSYKISEYSRSVDSDLQSNFTIKSVSKSTLKDKIRNKCEMSQTARFNESDKKKQVRLAANIPIMTTCEPTMTLTSQSATITSQTIGVPVCRADNHRICDDGMRSEFFNTFQNDQKIFIQRMMLLSTLISYLRYLICAYQKAYKKDGTKDKNLLGRIKHLLNIYFNKSKRELNKIYEPILSYKQRWGISTILKLAGGGESSLNSGGATNWGSTQTTAPNNNNTNQSGWVGTPGNAPGNAGTPSNWGGNSVNRSVSGNPNQNQNQGPPGTQNTSGNVNKVNNPNQQSNQQSGPPTSQSNSSQGNQNSSQWSQGKSNNPGGPGQNPQNNNNSVQQQSGSSTGGNNPSNNNAQGSVSSGNTSASNNPSTKQQLEQLNTMREALFSQDGWGCQHVNQDTSWDVPSSPEPNSAKDGVPLWKPSVNNGTDLWEANLRNGGQPPPHQQSKTPWGHTPATNIGGTWGEDDETTDTSNMWTNTTAPTQPNAAQWTAGNQAGTSWADPRIDHRDPRDLRSVDPREMRDPRDHRMPHDPREHMRVMDPMARDPRMGDMRGDPRGISGRLNGSNTETMWAQPPGPPHHQMGHQHPSGPPTKMLNPTNMNQWAAPPPKDMMPGKPSGWEEPSPPTQRRNVPNYDDGTSLWGNPAANQRTMPTSKVSHWKDLPTPNIGRGGMQCPPGMPQNRMPGQPGMKPDVGGPGMWGHPGAPGGRSNGTWADGPHDTTSWDDPKTPATWNEPPLNPVTWGGAPATHKQKSIGPAGSWVDSDIDPTPSWSHPAKPALTKDFIWNSREFRYLCDLGYKKEDVELALRNREMNRDEAQELLSQIRPLDQWPRRHDTHSGYDPTNQPTTAPAYPRFNHVTQQMSFPPGAGVPSAAATGGVGGSVSSASLLKLQQQQQQQTVPLQQQQPSTNAPQPPFNQASRAPQNQPSNQQLRMLVQQIQLAAQEGYLNHQILNQALSPQTLILLNQLLQQIKILQQLHQQHTVQSSLKGNSPSVLQISVQITKTKQQIANLQNQIAVQQATYMKQQHQQHAVNNAPPSQALEYYKTSVHDPMSVLQNSFSDLTMNKEPPVSQQQSRLNQWKLPSIDKDGDIGGNEFSRAPGTTSKQPTAPGGLTQSHSSPNMNPLLGQSDGTWSSRLGDSGWPDPGNSDSSDAKDWQPGGAVFTDLVPEFEPGKPWRGTQMKSIEDDPSITPGSVVRSPLSLAAIKDPDAIFSSSSKTSPPPQNPNPDTSIPSLSNSTWTFNPPATTPTAFTNSKNTWESAPPPTAVTSELWGAPMSKARGPPPGLGSKGAGSTSNGWAGLGTVTKSSSSWGGLQSNPVSNSSWVSTWLLLRNLTPQIDGSTLKTLCMQHGPVQDFRLYLNHGLALTKYSSRDEAIKAQGALNNCVLGNTTIFAESPGDSEVHHLLQQLSHGSGQQQAGGSGAASWGLRPTNKAGPPPDTWGGSSSQLWGAPPTTNSLWSNTGIDTSDQQRATPSSLNSYLPGDLLGDRISCLQVLNIMVILGFMLNYMLRVNLTIAIVSMVMPYNKYSHSNNSHEIIPIDNRTITDETIKRTIQIGNEGINGSTFTSTGHEELEQTRYPWNEYEVNLILGSFYWGYICTEIPGGRMAEIIGTRRVFGYSMLGSSAITLLTPLFATFGYIAVAILRIALGFMLGATWPAIQPMTARWIPPNERSKFVSNMMASSLGAAITLPICGFLIASLGWESVFYVTGMVGLTWSIAWFYFVYDSPSQHPRISVEERNYIEESIGTTSSTKHFPVPWKSIFTSLPVWAILITHGCSVFGYFTVVNQLPTYMKYILNFNIKENGILSSLPYLGKYIFALTTATLADYLRRTNKLSVTAIRKIFTTFAVLSPGLLMIVQAYLGRDPMTSVAIFTVALTINGAVTAGYLGNGLDIAPNFSGTIFGIANTISSFGGFLSSFIVGTITYQNQTYEQWRKIFWILAGTYCTGAFAFAFLGTGKLQKWNYPDIKSYEKNKTNLESNDDAEITEPLNNKTLS